MGWKILSQRLLEWIAKSQNKRPTKLIIGTFGDMELHGLGHVRSLSGKKTGDWGFLLDLSLFPA